jgi:mono/diheme cytochrome c family protein
MAAWRASLRRAVAACLTGALAVIIVAQAAAQELARPSGAATSATTVAPAVSLAPLAQLTNAPRPFAHADPAEGRRLHDGACLRCHDSMFGVGKGTELYGAFHRRATTASAVRQRVESCAVQNNAGWFEEELDHVSRWLNDEFYRFVK